VGFESTDPAVGLSMISALRAKRFKVPCTSNDSIPGPPALNHRDSEKVTKKCPSAIFGDRLKPRKSLISSRAGNRVRTDDLLIGIKSVALSSDSIVFVILLLAY
jgi:hypothetical protein